MRLPILALILCSLAAQGQQYASGDKDQDWLLPEQCQVLGGVIDYTKADSKGRNPCIRSVNQERQESAWNLVKADPKQRIYWHGSKNCHSPYPDCGCVIKAGIATCNQEPKCAIVQCENDDHYETYWECADLSAFLLTNGKGEKWCLSVKEGEK